MLPISADESESRARAKLPASPSGEDLPRGRAQVPDPEARGRRPTSARCVRASDGPDRPRTATGAGGLRAGPCT